MIETKDTRFGGGSTTVDVETNDPDTERFELPSPFAAGEYIDRFAVLGDLGRGGMGVVLSAYDTELERKVAIKVLRGDMFGSAVAEIGRLRMIREARAMARLAHPNVVTVFEADEINGQVYIVMEYVAGGTLRDWLDTERTEAQIVSAFLQAGRGLAAAHEAGLVHRDFKLENVLVDDKTGRFLVTDFGIAGSPVDGEERPGDTDTQPSPPPIALTHTGDVLGTPSYMAPEQQSGDGTDARSDQFSFCVALYEAVYGERPFSGRDLRELQLNIASGTRTPLTTRKRISPWLAAVIDRGLQLEPTDRYPSMRELLADLGRDRTRTRVRVALGLAVVLSVVGVGTGVWLARGGGPEPCRSGAQHLEGVWDEARSARIATLFRDTGAPHAPAMFDRAAERVNAWTDAWVDMRNDSCAATHVRNEQSPELLDRRTLCLNRALDGLRAVTDVWIEGVDSDAVDRALTTIASLPSVERCEDADALMAEAPLPADAAERETIASIERRLSDVAALYSVGKLRESHELARELNEQAEGIAYAPLRAQTRYLLATAQLRDGGSPQEAEKLLYEALDAASDARSDYMAALIWSDLLGSVAYRLDRPREALAMRRAAELAVKRAGNTPALRKRMLLNLTMAYNDAGLDEEAISTGREAIELLERETDPDADALARIHGWVAYAQMRRDRLGVAREHLEKSVAYADSLSPDHPRVVFPLSVLGQLEYYAGQPERSLEYLQRAEKVAQAAWGPDNPETGTVLMTLGIILGELERFDEARAALRRALAIAGERGDETDSAYIDALFNLGTVEVADGNYEAGLALYEDGLALASRGGMTIADTAHIELGVAEAYVELGEAEQALARVRAALEAIVRELGGEHEVYADLLVLEAKLTRKP